MRPVGVTKGVAMQRMLALMADVYGLERVNFDFVLCVGKTTWSQRPSIGLDLCRSSRPGALHASACPLLLILVGLLPLSASLLLVARHAHLCFL